jgi:hypothetical protein
MDNFVLIVPKGAEYVTATGRKINEGEPIPQPQYRDALITDEYIFRYGVHIQENKNGTYQFAPMQKHAWTVIANPDAKEKENFSDIPWIIGNMPVANMDFAFKDFVNMKTSPKIPSTIISMHGSYQNCSSLEVLPTLPQYVEKLIKTFQNCKNIKTYENSKDEDFNILRYSLPKYIRTMYSCFEGCEKIKNIPSLKELLYLRHAERAFANCKSLEAIKNLMLPIKTTMIDDIFLNCPLVKFEKDKNVSYSVSKKWSKPITEKSEIVPKMVGAPEAKGIFIRDGKKIKKMEKFPSKLETGDEFHVGDYVFKYNYKRSENEGTVNWVKSEEQNGWGVFYNGSEKSKTVPEINETILNAPVVNADYAFFGLASLETAPPTHDKIVSMEGTYKNCISLKQMPILSNTVKNLKRTFENCTSMNGIEEPDKMMRAERWRHIKMTPIPYSVKNIDYMFKGCKSMCDFPQISHLDNITSLEGTFEGCDSIVDLRKYKLPRVGNMERTFYRCSNLKYPPETINASKMRLTFGRCENLCETPQIGSSVQDMTGAFAYCKSIERATNRLAKIADKAFYMCENLKEIPKSVSSVKSAESAFEGCVKLYELCDLALFEKLENAKRMFKDCILLKAKEAMIMPKSTQNIDEMFYNCKKMNNTIILVSKQHGDDTAFKNTKIKVEVNHILPSDYKPTNTIPKGMTYYSAISGIVAKSGEEYPQIHDGDKAILGNYQYTYNEKQNGWSVKVLEQSKIKERLENVQNVINNCAVIDISKTFKDCKKLITPPRLPETITMANEAFKGCIALKMLPVLPDRVFTAKEAFSGCKEAYTYFGAIGVGQYGNFTDYRLPQKIEYADKIFDGCEAMLKKPDISMCRKLQDKDTVFGATKEETVVLSVEEKNIKIDDIDL